MNPTEEHRFQSTAEIREQGANDPFLEASKDWVSLSMFTKYSYHFEWMGIPIIQYPQDIMAMQEIVFDIKPDLIIETGIAHGGSLVFYSSLLELNAACGGPQDAEVVGVDIEIRPHNRKAIEAHPMSRRVRMLEGSSTDSNIITAISELAVDRERVLVCLDSLHSHEHVLAELEAYAPMTSVGSYCVVFDTVAETLPQTYFDIADRRCGIGNSPMTALAEFLVNHPEFEVDWSMSNKLMISVAPGGYLRRLE